MDSAGSDGVLVSSDASDSDDIRWAIETASAMWSKADYPEALRWLRRAAEMASEEGADLRAVELAKVAAELRTRIDIPATGFPPAVAAAAAEDTSVAPSSDEVFERAAERLLNSDPPPAMTWSSIISIEAQAADEPAPPSSVKPPPKPPPLDPQRRITPDPSRSTVTPLPRQPTPARLQAAIFSTATPTNGTKPHTPSLSSAASAVQPAPPAADPVVSHQAIRVAVTTSADQPGVFIARALAAGERPPAGAKEALFIALEPGVDLNG